MIKITINRTYDDKQTPGEGKLDRDGDRLCSFKTLELPWENNISRISCIPEGLYKVVVRYSNKYSRHLHITDVEGRSYILIHWGNYAGSLNPRSGKSDILGCVLVGKSFADINNDGIKDITASKHTFDIIMKFIKDEDQIELEIC